MVIMRKYILFVGMILYSFSIDAKYNINQKNASYHTIVCNSPAPDFFEGALLGNGALGVVVTTRPDAICLHFGHNNVWDIRVAENNREKLGTFKDIFAKADAIPDTLYTIHQDKEFSDYLNLSAQNYHHSYPRPFPCGTLLLGFDRRDVELLGHMLDISNGLCTIFLLVNGEKQNLSIFVDMQHDNVWLALTDTIGNARPSCFNRVRILPDSTPPSEIPQYALHTEKNGLGFYQRLPRNVDGSTSDKDKAFSLGFLSNQYLIRGTRTTTLGIEEPLADMERYIVQSEKAFVAVVQLKEGSASDSAKFIANDINIDIDAWQLTKTQNECIWGEYWDKSGVSFDDKELEAIWYRNLYFFNCAVKPGVSCPGLFANWSWGNIGTAWHGDYHLNYNTQQPFWLTFSSNHLEKNLAYADLVDHLLPVSRMWARDYYEMRGAFFPHSAYPIDMTMHPYPVPDWGWEVFETPWMVQGLWWHYLYSADKEFLRKRAFIPIKDAVMFLVDYMMRDDAHGSRWNDDKYHIFPSVPPELYGLQPGFNYNYDTQIDITLTRFVFKAYLQAVEDLNITRDERNLVSNVKHILRNMPSYPTYKSDKYGEIYVSVPGEKDRIVYNVPATLTHVFPGEEYGMDAPDSIYCKLMNTIKAHKNEGGNDIVFLSLQQARLGVLDIERFKRQVRYATLPNATVTDAVMQQGGRYNDNTDYMYMAGMGIWFENFALPVVINECLMQSYNGVIRLFPNWDINNNTSFSTLRARGAFLVSATLRDGKILPVTIFSEKGRECSIINPWKDCRVKLESDVETLYLSGDVLTFKTLPNISYTITPDR